jgi:hypothetical protein
MKAQPTHSFCFFSALVVISFGCYSLPKQSGTWEGVACDTLLYDANGKAHDCMSFKIQHGPQLKMYVPAEVVLVKSDLKCYPVSEVPGTRLRISGKICSTFPTSQTGAKLLGYRPEPQHDFPGIYVLKVRTYQAINPEKSEPAKP